MSTRMTTNRRQEALGTLHVLPDEIICAIVEDLSPRDVGRLSCVSSVFYIICNEEPLWMRLCLHNFEGELDYKVSWKQTAKEILQLTRSDNEVHQKIPFSEGFSSLFLYRRWYRCRITLDNFVFDKGDIERIHDISNEDFSDNYDRKKPVLFTGLANDWNARRNWTLENLTERYGELAFRISQSSAKSITMKFKNYVSYMKQQHDEDPLYIFDAKFGEAAPALLEDYDVPHLFQENFFSLLEDSQRPPYRWLVIGPSRSGASWHVDPTLTSAWNTLLQGRKRWALYPPCKVPPGVTVHVNEDDGDVNIESPSSLQWWFDIYPLLAEEDKPIECTQLPGETIYVPSGWWHCVLNIDASIAVTQNFVNEKNFEFVCLDLAPGHLHKGVARSGWLALEDRCGGIKDGKMTRASDCLGVDVEYSVESLSSYLDENRNQYSSKFCEGNVLSPRDVRGWLHKLWVSRPEMRDLTWKGADIVLNARKWLDAVVYICTTNCLPVPIDSEKLPVGHGSNPVYLVGDYVIKLYVEEGVEASMFSLGSELEFHDLLMKFKSPLINHVPHIVASGILCFNGGSYESVLWNGKGVPSILERYNLFSEGSIPPDYSFSTWNKMHAISKTSGNSADYTSNGDTPVWPYVVTRRCKGEDFAHVREKLSKHDYLDLASFLGQQVRHLHSLPLPPLPTSSKRMKLSNGCKVNGTSSCSIDQDNGASFSSANCYNCTPQGSCYKDLQLPAEWELFIGKMRKLKDNVKERLRKWNDCPGHLIEEAEGYLPQDPTLLLNIHVENGILKVLKTPRWLHMDIMDDNIQMEPYPIAKFVDDHSLDDSWIPTANNNVELEGGGIKEQGQRILRPSCLLDFSDLSIGDPIYELLAIYIDVFKGNNDLLKQFLSSYRLPFFERIDGESFTADYSSEKLSRLSYHAMCYCILHEDNVLGAIFSIWKELKKAKSWEEIEMTVWGKLNYFEASY